MHLKLILPLTKMRYVSPLVFILKMKGDNVVTKSDAIASGGGTRIVTLFRNGRFNRSFQFFTSGNWSFNIRIVLLVAVAVISRSFPPMTESSPVESSIAGLNAAPLVPLRPQLATKDILFII